MLLEDKRPIERFQDMLQQMGAHSLWKYPVRNDKKKKKSMKTIKNSNVEIYMKELKWESKWRKYYLEYSLHQNKSIISIANTTKLI